MSVMQFNFEARRAGPGGLPASHFVDSLMTNHGFERTYTLISAPLGSNDLRYALAVSVPTEDLFTLRAASMELAAHLSRRLDQDCVAVRAVTTLGCEAFAGLIDGNGSRCTYEGRGFDHTMFWVPAQFARYR